jgi:hypothetical protein
VGFGTIGNASIERESMILSSKDECVGNTDQAMAGNAGHITESRNTICRNGALHVIHRLFVEEDTREGDISDRDQE